MTNAHSFPLFRVPFVALKVVIKQMFAKTQLDFSTLSIRAKRIVRASTLKQKICLWFCSFSSMGDIEIGIKLPKSNSFHVIHLQGAPIRETFSEMKEVITNMYSVFKNLGVTLSIYNGGLYRLMFELIPIIKQMNIPLDFINVPSYETNDDLCKSVLEVARDAKTLCIRQNFQPPELGTFELEHLEIHQASWFTRDHLLNNFLNCSVIELKGSKMTTQDVNEFFKKWIEGSKMMHFRWMPTISQQGSSGLLEVLDGIQCTAVKKVLTGSYTREFEDGGCFMIKQVGGVKAIVYQYYRGVGVTMTTYFSLV